MSSSLATERVEPLPNVVRPPRIVPRSLFSRSLLIVILPLVILQVVLTYLFYERHWDKVTRTLAFGIAGEVGLLVELLEAAKTRRGSWISRASTSSSRSPSSRKPI
jgi:two-component system osmolarity sensor histidine kinase EnvZ